MKMVLTFTLLLSTLTISGNVQASSDVNEIIKSTKEEKTTKKKRRRKKALMCNECGKPEVECECEGHGNEEAKHDGHKDHKDH